MSQVKGLKKPYKLTLTYGKTFRYSLILVKNCIINLWLFMPMQLSYALVVVPV